MTLRILLRGGGDLSSGVAYRLVRAGWRVLITELERPLAVRRTVSFAQAVYDGQVSIEGIIGQRITTLDKARRIMDGGGIAVQVDPDSTVRREFDPHVLIDGRMTKMSPELDRSAAPLVIGMGPGFTAGENCHAVIETVRGISLGRVYWSGSAAQDTGLPDPVGEHHAERVLRAPCDGRVDCHAEIGSIVDPGQLLATVSGCEIRASFRGLLRGLIQPGSEVVQGLKVGDIDPRLDPEITTHFSDKSLAVAGGVLEAILSTGPLRVEAWAR